MRMIKYFLVVITIIFFGSILSAQVREPLIIPQPKYMEKGNWNLRISTENNALAEILIESGKPMLKIGAEEINKYVERFGGSKLPIKKIGQESVNAQLKIYLISNIEKSQLLKKFSLSKVHIPEAKCSSQSYVIRVQNNSILLGGYGEIGGLYAAITFCHLLKNKNGVVYAYKTSIDDYPDFAYRGCIRIGNIFSTRGYLYDKKRLHIRLSYIELLKQVIDLGLHLKINFIWETSKNFVYQGHNYTDEINLYARERGFEITSLIHASFFEDGPEFQEYLRKTGKTKKDFMYLRGRYFCWSKDKLLRKFVKDGVKKNITMLQYHCPDTEDENWGKRCDECREKFGSDRAKADAHVINIFYDELKKIDPKIKLLAIIQPYKPEYLNPEYYEYYRDYQKFYHRLSGLIPQDMYITARETDRNSIKIWNKTTSRPNYLFFMYRDIYSTQMLAPAIRTIKTLYFPERKKDILMAVTGCPCYWYLDTPLAAEYSWNTEAPGSSFMNPKNKFEFDPRGKTNSDLLHKIIPRAAQYLWGKEASSIVTEIYQSGLNIDLVIHPFQSQKRLKIAKVVYKLNPEDFAFQEKAAEKVCNLCLPIMRGEVKVSHPWLVGDITRLYKHTTAVKLLAPVYQHYFAALNAVEEGDVKKAAKEIAIARDINAQIKPKLEKEKSFVKAFAQVSYSFMSSTMKHPEPFEFLTKKLKQFHVPSQEQIQKTFLSPSLLDEVKNRVVKAVFINKPPIIDGELSDKCWINNKYPVKHFVRYPFTGVPKLALDQSEVKLCYDKKNLYIAFRLYDADVDSLTVKERTRDSDDFFKKDDIVEIFINANRKNKNLAQLVVNPAGSKFDSFKKWEEHTSLNFTKEWNPDWQVDTHILNDGWIAEIAIPFSIFKKKPSNEINSSPKPGDIWRINLTREKRTLELSGIKYMQDADFRTVEKYSKLIFLNK